MRVCVDVTRLGRQKRTSRGYSNGEFASGGHGYQRSRKNLLFQIRPNRCCDGQRCAPSPLVGHSGVEALGTATVERRNLL